MRGPLLRPVRLEAVEHRGAKDVDVSLAGVVAADIVVLLPFRARREIAQDGYLHPEADREIGIGAARAAAGREARYRRARVGVGGGVIDAELRVQRQLAHQRHEADPGQFPGLGLDVAIDRDPALRAGRLGFAEIGVRVLGGEVAVYLVAAEDLPRLVRLVGAD